MSRPTSHPSDDELVRRASRRVALNFGLAIVIVAALGLVGALLFVLHRVPEQLLDFPFRDLSMTLGARDFLLAGIFGAAVAVIVAVVAALLITRRAVRPLAFALRLQRDFVADASHELRTPLAVLTLRIQAIEAEPDLSDEVRDELHALRQDAARLNSVISDLLEAAQLSATRAHGQDAVDAVSAVAAGIDDMLVLAADKGVHVDLQASGPLLVAVPEERLRRCIVILVDNAIRHSPPDSTITVTVRAGGRRMRIRVADQGSGIVGIDPSRIFERFAHSRPADEADGRPHGIGLSLVKDTAVRYGGSVRLVSTSAAGTVFELAFPLLSSTPRSARTTDAL